ncbi:hypothetical protein O3P69_020399 [Scylla paramamosain]|uniref:Uncharacterized protein n=1 Tax=Scylla paramamosain TaxID=85552 RepID=A0AAW0TKW0_SCYPA
MKCCGVAGRVVSHHALAAVCREDRWPRVGMARAPESRSAAPAPSWTRDERCLPVTAAVHSFYWEIWGNPVRANVAGSALRLPPEGHGLTLPLGLREGPQAYPPDPPWDRQKPTTSTLTLAFPRLLATSSMGQFPRRGERVRTSQRDAPASRSLPPSSVPLWCESWQEGSYNPIGCRKRLSCLRM